MAIRLAVPAYCCATVIPAFEVWRLLLLAGTFAVTGTEGLTLFLLGSFGALLLSLVWFLAWVGAYALLLKILWSNPPQWLKLPKFSILINRDFSVLVLAVLPIAIAVCIYTGFTPILRQNPFTEKSLKLTYELLLPKFAWIWLIAAACFYQWQWYSKPKEKVSKRQKSHGT